MLAVVRLGRTFAPRFWSPAITHAARNSAVDLGVAPTAPSGRTVGEYTSLRRRITRRDFQAPSAPSVLVVGSVQRTAFSLVWGRSRDNVGVARYRVVANGRLRKTAHVPRAVVGGLSCATPYVLSVKAQDAAGNLSRAAAVSASTAACSTTPPRGALVLQPGQSLDTAYRNAKPGDVIVLAPGCWGIGTDIRFDSAKPNPSQPITFMAQDPNNRPVFGSCTAGAFRDLAFQVSGARSLSIDGVVINGNLGVTPWWDTAGEPLARNVVFRNSKIKNTVAHSVDGLTYRSVEFGNYSYAEGPHGPGSSWIGRVNPSYPPSKNVLFERSSWRNIVRGGSPTHPECLKLNEVDGVIIRDSRMEECPVMALFLLSDTGGMTPRNALFEHNYFDCSDLPGDDGCGATINMRPDAQFQNVTFRSNIVNGLFYMQGVASSYLNVRMENHFIGSFSTCLRPQCDPGQAVPPYGPRYPTP